MYIYTCIYVYIYDISYHLISHHIISDHVMACRIVIYHIISYHIISHHIMLSHVITYHIISCHFMAYHIIAFISHKMRLYHIKSYSTISCHIVQYRIMLCHIIAYFICSTSPPGGNLVDGLPPASSVGGHSCACEWLVELCFFRHNLKKKKIKKTINIKKDYNKIRKKWIKRSKHSKPAINRQPGFRREDS